MNNLLGVRAETFHSLPLYDTVQGMSERITEEWVRSHFKADPIYDQVLFEEQRSSREKIQRLFASASKSGTGKPGFPEFIISFQSKSNLIVIVECKFDDNLHESRRRDKPKGYAVDGILHYMRCVNKVDPSLDIIGIAVSGATEETLCVSHFYSEEDSSDFTEAQDNHLLSLQSYLKIHDNEVLAKELSNIHIQQKAVEYNNELHGYEIPETERCTFISAVLIALQNDFFRHTYSKATSVADLVSQLLKACGTVLKLNGITEDRRETILHQYRNIRGHKITKLEVIRNKKSGKEEINDAVMSFINRINVEIYPLVRLEGQGFDVLGRFYREFVRYAGSDQATGLVLTPEHITDLFCDLVRLTVNDRVYDPCCGTGGFLIASLKRMIAIAGHDVDKIKAIKEHQLMGSEVRADMFTYACSNMMMRGDGKSQIFDEDCFSSQQKGRTKAFAPTVAMLNPPYSKANGPDKQLGFIVNVLDDMAVSGRCAAIVQMSCALTTKKEIVAQHRRLMRNHRLDAVVTCPDQLFYPIGVNTCIMVFTAHVPHPSNYPTWFGYLKDDGFVIHKKKGRVPAEWEQKRARFLAAYDHYDVPGLSIRAKVKAEDEWCAEAYLETDFSRLTKADFLEKIRTYVGFQFTSGNIDSIEPDPDHKDVVDLSPAKWKVFSYDKIFNIEKGYYNKKPPEAARQAEHPVSFIGATAYNNGVTSIHELDDVILFSRSGEENPYEDQNRKIFPPHAVTVSNNGSVGNAFYQPRRFTCSHDVNPLYLIERKISPEIGMFLSAVIEVDRYRWGYGRKWRPARMPKSKIALPVDAKGQPDWTYVERLIKSLAHSSNLKNAELRTTEANVSSENAEQNG